MSDLAVGLLIVAGAGVVGVAVSWCGWASLTLVAILRAITSNNERLDDHERRLTDLEI